ncbi:hypothetical protein C8R43DRAFT_933883 [Mycena crocata]|nr:hypothetical protein C8R43DRAFT_933883 [Mycena crocata]
MDTDPDPSAVPTEPIRAEGLWFEDCGLIIQAEHTLFRVSRDVLAAQSPVFGDMLSLPPPTDADMMGGCPFVRLPDSAADVTAFLKALFYYDFFEPHPSPTTFQTLSGVLRMSHKYEVEALRKRALTHISSLHPTTLGEWEKFESTAGWFNELSDDSFLPLVVLARQISIDWILPITLYRLCRDTHERIIIEGADGFDLAPEDKIRCIVAFRQLETTRMSRILDFLWMPLAIKGCLTGQQCSTSRIRARREAEANRECNPNEIPDLPLEAWSVHHWDTLNVCHVCFLSMKTRHKQAKQAFWDGLPEIFGLPDWTTLEAMKAEAFE